LVEHLGGAARALPSTTAAFDRDGHPHRRSASQVTGSSWTP
jgi:hypothetical protein